MLPYLIALTFPPLIKKQLSLLCSGLQTVHWVEEENLHLTLCYLGPITDALLFETQERLKLITFSPFHLTLKTVQASYDQRGQGQIWTSASPQETCMQLKRKIDHALKELELPQDRAFHPHVTLGRYHSINSNQLADYLSYHYFYLLENIEITEFSLLSSQQTSKRQIYHTVARYPLA